MQSLKSTSILHTKSMQITSWYFTTEAPDGENICLHCIAPLQIEANGKSSTESRNQVQQIFPQMQKRRLFFLDSKESGAKASVMSCDSFGFSSGTYLLNFFLS